MKMEKINEETLTLIFDEKEIIKMCKLNPEKYKLSIISPTYTEKGKFEFNFIKIKGDKKNENV